MTSTSTSTSERYEPAVRILTDETSGLGNGSGGQLAIFRTGQEPLFASAGLMTPVTKMTDSVLHNVWCATKPIVAISVLHELWQRGCAETPIAALVPKLVADSLPPSVGGLTVADLVSHAGGLVTPGLFDAMMLAPEDREASALAGLRFAQSQPTYGSYLPAKLLEFVCRELSVNLADTIRGWARANLQYHCEIEFDLGKGQIDRVGPYVVNRVNRMSYAYHDRSPNVCGQDRIALGGFVSMRALAEFYFRLTDEDAFESQFLSWLLSRPIISVNDPSMDMTSSYQAGLLHLVVGKSNQVVLGHPGYSGCSFGFVAPKLGLAAAFMTNGLFVTHQDIDFFRTRMLSTIIRIAEIEALH